MEERVVTRDELESAFKKMGTRFWGSGDDPENPQAAEQLEMFLNCASDLLWAQLQPPDPSKPLEFHTDAYVATEGVVIDGDLDFYVYVTTDCDDPDAEVISELARVWNDHAASVELVQHFSLSKMVRYVINHHTVGKEKLVAAEDRPIFDTLRHELAAMLEMIDALKFVPSDEELRGLEPT